MVRVVWRFEVRPEHVEQFKAIYGSDGDWAKLFRRSAFYHGTELIRKEVSPPVYEVIDHWQDMKTYNAFKAEYRTDYDSLDKRCEQLTIKETAIGYFPQE